MASGGQNENSNDGLLYAIFFIVLLAGIWYLFGKNLSIAYVYSKKIEYYILKLLFVNNLFPGAWADRVGPIEPLLMSPGHEALKFKDLNQIGSAIGFFSRWLYAAGLGFLAYKVLQKNPLQKFRRQHDMRSLTISEQRLWPAISPVVKLELVKEDIDKGPCAMSRKPYDFAKYYKLLDEGNKLNRDRAEKLFSTQLGKLWDGPNKLPPYAKALFACFAAQACGEIDECKSGLDKLSISMAAGKPDYTWVAGVLAKYEKRDNIQKVIKAHAYVYTVMPAMLKSAREYGVLQSPQFIWLRPKNRQLWYILNGVGRRVAFAEIGGIYAHWIAEEVAGHPIERPFVVKAVDGLERAILDVKIE